MLDRTDDHCLELVANGSHPNRTQLSIGQTLSSENDADLLGTLDMSSLKRVAADQGTTLLIEYLLTHS